MLINELLEKLNQIHPLSVRFRYALACCMSGPVMVDKWTEFLNAGDVVDFAGYLQSGFVKGSVFDEKGREMIVRLYKPGDIFTDLDGFFKNERANMCLSSVAPCVVLLLKRKDYLKLEKLPETEKLKAHVLLLEKQIDFDRAYMMTLQARDRFVYFAERYPFSLLPNRSCASFLSMYEPDYSKFKGWYLRER